MDRGQRLTDIERRRIRTFVLRAIRWARQDSDVVDDIRMVYSQDAKMKVYALAYFAALATAAPLDLARVRDSGS